MNMLNLNKNWKMHEEPMKWNKDFLSVVTSQKDGWYECDLPVDVRMPLLEQGVIREPLKADYCFESEWIERRSWWFTKEFSGEGLWDDNDIIELVIEGLDTRSDIFMNGHYIGTHKSVHYPFVCDVKEFLNPGKNMVAVRLTSGLEEIRECDVADIDYVVSMEVYNGRERRGDKRRAFVRRPQYTCGWDWGPKVTTIGITGNVFLRGYKNIAIRDVRVETKEIYYGESKKDALVEVSVNVEDLNLIASKECDLKIVFEKDGKIISEEELDNCLLTSGANYIETEMIIPDAQLWWPNGAGKQPLYHVKICAVSREDGHEEKWPEFQYGIRMIKLDTSPLEKDNRKFEITVNEMPVFCKGGDWIPNDFIYARVPDRKYEILLEEAVEANFNMIRIWGGGLYERDLFYELCDQKGILVWQNFMFACATHPDHQEWFKTLMRYEIDYQTKRLRNHCCIGLFCGTNEVHWIYNPIDNPGKFKFDFTQNEPHGLYIANTLAKELVRQNCPSIPYWNSSPYGGKTTPNEDTVGDIHWWRNAFMSPHMEERIEAKDYDKIQAKFVSEYGYVGPCCLESTKEYMDGQPLDRKGAIWRHHSNVFEKGTVETAIAKNYADNPEDLSIEDYILYGGMVHSLMYEYSLEALRFKQQCYGGLFWMYNDAWGEVGWTIIDYYLRRKIPFYGVKRALAHRKFTMRIVDGKVILQGLNDTPELVCANGRFGYVSFDGKIDMTRSVTFHLKPFSREYVLTEAVGDHDFQTGTYMLYVDSDEIDNIWLRTEDNRRLKYERSDVRIVSCRNDGENKKITVMAKGYVHGVYIKGDMDCDDNYFDLLPGESKTVTVRKAAGKELEVGSVR
ncbi:MAG: beta-mannosidase [Eubacteriales bacterium]|nr:beta-mannosidase [Eubacteriales bacterium]